MAEGSNAYKGLAVPLYGESEIVAQTAATDILSITGAASHTGDYIVCQTSTGTEEFVVAAGGAVTVTGDVTLGAADDIILQKTDQTTFGRLRLPILETAASSASLSKGDIWLAKATTDVYRMALCISTATGAERFGGRITRVTLGSASH